jgi:hypothetical protein
MTNRVSYAPQDFQKKCIQAERDQESRKLALLLARVKRQIADREDLGAHMDSAKRLGTALAIDSEASKMPRRLAPFER